MKRIEGLFKYFGVFVIVLAAIAVVGLLVRGEATNKSEEAHIAIGGQNQTKDNTEQGSMDYFNGDNSQMIDLVKGNASLHLVYKGASKFTAKIISPTEIAGLRSSRTTACTIFPSGHPISGPSFSRLAITALSCPSRTTHF